MMLIPPGRIWLGEVEEKPDERTCRTIKNPFWISKYEISQKVWKQVMGKLPEKIYKKFIGDDFPIVRMNKPRVQSFCQKTKLQIPDEVRWEYAARGGTTGYFYWAKAEWLPNKVNSISRWYKRPILAAKNHDKGYNHQVFLQMASLMPVDSFDANPFGLHNVLGNAQEWCQGVWRYNDYLLRGGGASRACQHSMKKDN